MTEWSVPSNPCAQTRLEMAVDEGGSNISVSADIPRYRHESMTISWMFQPRIQYHILKINYIPTHYHNIIYIVGSESFETVVQSCRRQQF